MSSIDRLIARLRNNPRAARYNDLERVLRSIGWRLTSSRGSHCRFEPADGSGCIVIVKPHGREPLCAVMDVRRVLALVEEHRGRHQD